MREKEARRDVLVLDASRRAALAIVRSLGKKTGIRLTVADSRIACPAFLSRFVLRKFRYPAPEKNPDVFCKFLLSHLRENEYDVLFPVHDLDLIPIARNRSLFEPLVKVVLPPQPSFEATLDKIKTLSLARELGIPVPETFEVNTPDEFEAFAHRLPYSVVLKPRSQVTWTEDGRAAVSLVGAENYVDFSQGRNLTLLFNRIGQRSSPNRPVPLLLQERVSGRGAGVAALFSHGEPRALFSYRRLHEYPTTGGPSTLRMSTDEPRLKKYAEEILQALNWHGVAMVEFKVDDESGRVWLIEVNGRFWGSLALPIASGIDFPYLVYQLALHGDCPTARRYTVGVKMRWLVPGELLWLASSLRSGSSNNGPSGARLRTLKEFFGVRGAVQYDYESWADPLPTIGVLVSALADGLAVMRGRRSVMGEYLADPTRTDKGSG